MVQKVFLDPSLIVCRSELVGLERRISTAREEYEDDFEFYLPESLVTFIRRTESQRDFANSALVKFFGSGRSKSELTQVENFIESTEAQSFGDEHESYETPNEEVLTAFEEELDYYRRYAKWQLFRDVVVEEYTFLIRMSIISAAEDRILDLIERVGTPVLRVGKRLAERAIRKRLDLDQQDELSIVDVLRGVGKYVILGFSKVMGGFSGALLGLALGLGPSSLALKLIGAIAGAAMGEAFVASIDPSPAKIA